MKRKILIILIITFFTYYKFLFNGFFFEDSHIFRNGYEKTLIKNFYSGYDHTYEEGEFAYRPLIKI
ncbi:MAG TPA: hypothetical protein PK189_08020, partial [bacterium]|nr:hypothetical protein [bacterium]